MRKTAGGVLVSLVVVGVAAAIVYGSSSLIALAPPQKPISPSLALTTTVSGWIAALCLGPLAVVGLVFLFGDTLRLLIPAHHERFNLELARYRRSAGDGATEEGLRYVTAWRDLNRRTSLLLCLFVLPVVPALIRPSREWSMALMTAWVVALVVLGLWQRAFVCPRCNERFHGRHRTRLAPPFCTNCGLPKDSAPTDAVARDFEEWKKWNVNPPAGFATSRYRGRKRR